MPLKIVKKGPAVWKLTRTNRHIFFSWYNKYSTVFHSYSFSKKLLFWYGNMFILLYFYMDMWNRIEKKPALTSNDIWVNNILKPVFTTLFIIIVLNECKWILNLVSPKFNLLRNIRHPRCASVVSFSWKGYFFLCLSI